MSGYGKIAWPLTEQLKKNIFGWNEGAKEAFRKLKTAMTIVPVSALPDFSTPFIVEIDASRHGPRAILMQGQRPISYFSHVLLAQARHKSIYERELMAIVFAEQKWRPYLIGHKFIVHTDQRSLKFLLEQRLVAVEHQRWITNLMGYDFEVQYWPGLENKAADALSRQLEEVSLATLFIPHVGAMEELQQQVQ